MDTCLLRRCLPNMLVLLATHMYICDAHIHVNWLRLLELQVKCLDDGREYVMKRVTLAQNSEADKNQAMMEVEVLSSLKHPHIVPYKECYWVGQA